MIFIGDLDEVKYFGTKGAHRDILRPAGVGQMRKVAGIGSFKVLSNGTLDGQAKFVLAHKLPLGGRRRRYMCFDVSRTTVSPEGNRLSLDRPHSHAICDL